MIYGRTAGIHFDQIGVVGLELFSLAGCGVI
jgi:hypothetical protein